MGLDTRTFVHCECGAWVSENLELEPTKVEEGNTRCTHRDDLQHYIVVKYNE
jgi:hypothetical protein